MQKYKITDILTNRKRINKNIVSFTNKLKKYDELSDDELLMIQIEITSKYNRSKMMLNVLFVTIIVSSFLGIGKYVFELMMDSVSRNDLILASGENVRLFAISLFASTIFIIVIILVMIFVLLMRNIKKLEEEKMIIDSILDKRRDVRI